MPLCHRSRLEVRKFPCIKSPFQQFVDDSRHLPVLPCWLCVVAVDVLAFRQLWGNIFSATFVPLRQQARKSAGTKLFASQTFQHLLDRNYSVCAVICLKVTGLFCVMSSPILPLFLSAQAVRTPSLQGWWPVSVFPVFTMLYPPFDIASARMPLCLLWLPDPGILFCLIRNSITACGRNHMCWPVIFS